ncbi:MAG TPA: hypothetical protein DDY54_09970 [Deltaproteobacteria bacterium]|nr:hypothetical protein [Deltaproteobacteria bacterium]
MCSATDSTNLSVGAKTDFKVGNGFFQRLWVSSPSSTKSADGLGPLFNARSCQRCLLKDGRGHPPAANWPDDDAVSMFLHLSIPPQNEEQRRRLAEHRALTIPEPTYGGQLQDLAIQGHRAEGRMHIEYEEKTVLLAEGETTSLRKPAYTVTNWNYGPPHPELLTSPRGNLVIFWSAPERRVLSHLRWKTAAASLPERKLENFCSPAAAGSSWPCTTRSHFTLLNQRDSGNPLGQPSFTDSQSQFRLN